MEKTVKKLEALFTKETPLFNLAFNLCDRLSINIYVFQLL